MKYLVILLMLVASCSKKNSTCFTCEIGSNVNGNTYPDRKVCTDGEYPDLGEIVDENGNELGWYCEKD